MKGGVIGIGVYRRRSNREKVIDENWKKSWRKDRSLRNTTIYRFIGRTMAVYNSCYRTTGKEIREKVTERGIDSERGKFRNQSFVPDYIESFRYVKQRQQKIHRNA